LDAAIYDIAMATPIAVTATPKMDNGSAMEVVMRGGNIGGGRGGGGRPPLVPPPPFRRRALGKALLVSLLLASWFSPPKLAADVRAAKAVVAIARTRQAFILAK